MYIYRKRKSVSFVHSKFIWKCFQARARQFRLCIFVCSAAADAIVYGYLRVGINGAAILVHDYGVWNGTRP